MISQRHTLIFSVAALLMLLFSGCHHNARPDNVVDTATLADFLVEAQIIESYANTVVNEHRDSLAYQIAAAYDSLYARLGITSADYDSSMSYYSHYPLVLEQVYSRVAERLRRLDQPEERR